MRISVECGGFTRAADACLTANHVSAVLVESLATRLAGSAGMAGNDATSAGFARAYDAGARQAVSALADLTHAFIGVARLLASTGERHAAAEAAAAGVVVSAYAGGHLDESFVRVRPPAPPSSLGHQEPALGPVDAWILDHGEGFVWPRADVERLRVAAADWRRAAASTAGLADHVDAAIALVREQRSPEVPLAVDAMTDLGVLVGDTAWQLASLATACEEYADAVEDVHARTRALLAEVAQMVVEGAAISVLVAGLSGGLGGGAAAAAAAARIRTQAPRFYALLAAVRATIATTVARMERIADDLAAARARLERFLRVPARGETGSMRHPAAWSTHRRPGWLSRHEVPPGHTIERHVGKTIDELAQRLEGYSNLRRASTFDDQASAERFISSALEKRQSDLRTWLADADRTRRFTITEDLGTRTGTSLLPDGSTGMPTGVRIVLLADPHASSGWRILTAFPD
ncbi:MAG TPA: RNase A-like domain-containing protein [Nocardioides sp.]